MVQKIFRVKDLPERTGYSIPHLYEMIREDKFPRPIKLGPKAVGWLESEIAAWQAARIAQRDGKAA